MSRQLTPNERRQVEQIKDMIAKGYGHLAGVSCFNEDGNLVINLGYGDNDIEFWQTILSLALEANEARANEWRKVY